MPGERFDFCTRDLFLPIRVAITGRKAAPPLFETLAVLGKPMTQFRLRKALAALKAIA